MKELEERVKAANGETRQNLRNRIARLSEETKKLTEQNKELTKERDELRLQMEAKKTEKPNESAPAQ